MMIFDVNYDGSTSSSSSSSSSSSGGCGSRIIAHLSTDLLSKTANLTVIDWNWQAWQTTTTCWRQTFRFCLFLRNLKLEPSITWKTQKGFTRKNNEISPNLQQLRLQLSFTVHFFSFYHFTIFSLPNWRDMNFCHLTSELKRDNLAAIRYVFYAQHE